MPALGYLVFTAIKALATTLLQWGGGLSIKRFTLAFSLESLRIRAILRLKLILALYGALLASLCLLIKWCRDVFLICIKSIMRPLAHYKSINSL